MRNCLVTTYKHVNNIRASARQPAITIGKLWNAVFSVGSAPSVYNKMPDRLYVSKFDKVKMQAYTTAALSVAFTILFIWGRSARKEDISTAPVPQINPNLLSTSPLLIQQAKSPQNIPRSLRLLLTAREKRLRHLPCSKSPPTMQASQNAKAIQPPSIEPPEPQGSAEAASGLWDPAASLLNAQTFFFIGMVANVLLLYYNIGHGWIKKLYSAMSDKAAAAATTGGNVRKKVESTTTDHRICRRSEPFMKPSKLPKPPFWNYTTPAGRPATSRIYGRVPINTVNVDSRQIPRAGGMTAQTTTLYAISHTVSRIPRRVL